MEIADFGVEKWMNEFEDDAVYNIAETCVESITIEQLLNYGDNKEETFAKIAQMKMTYGSIEGSIEFRSEVAKLFTKKLSIDNITVTHGAAGANHLVYETLIEEGDHVIVFVPTYQQHYSIPKAMKADVELIELLFEDDYQPDIEKLKKAIRPTTKAICLNNPNNPTGAIIEDDLMQKIVECAKKYKSYVICDEVYRGLNHQKGFDKSIVDLYERGISTGSLSKVFSLAGLRLGWIVANQELIEKINTHRDYNTISCGIIDDYLGTIALKNKEKILKRNLKIVNDNIRVLDEWVQKTPKISYVKPKGGTTAFLKYDLDILSDSLCRDLMAKTGVMLVPGSALGCEYYLRIGYANSIEILEKGLDIFAKYLSEQ